MILERTAAYVLAVACVFQTLHPSWTIKPHRWRKIDVQIGPLRVQARNNADSVCFEAHRGQKEPKRLKICISDSSCITEWSDGTSHVWLISRDMI